VTRHLRPVTPNVSNVCSGKHDTTFNTESVGNVFTQTSCRILPVYDFPSNFQETYTVSGTSKFRIQIKKFLLAIYFNLHRAIPPSRFRLSELKLVEKCLWSWRSVRNAFVTQNVHKITLRTNRLYLPDMLLLFLLGVESSRVQYQPRRMMSGWNEWLGKPKYPQKACPSAASSTRNPRWLNLGSNTIRSGGKPATNRLSYGTAVCLTLVSLR
jgi:hypothetical protein